MGLWLILKKSNEINGNMRINFFECRKKVYQKFFSQSTLTVHKIYLISQLSRKNFMLFFMVVTLAPKTKELIVVEAKTELAWKAKHSERESDEDGKINWKMVASSLPCANSGNLGFEFSFFLSPTLSSEMFAQFRVSENKFPNFTSKTRPTKKVRMRMRICMFSPGLVGGGWGGGEGGAKWPDYPGWTECTTHW